MSRVGDCAADAQTLRAYGDAARYYAAGGKPAKNTDHEPDLVAFLAHLKAGARVLDLGCGPGQWAARLRQEGCAVEAMDAAPEMAALAQERYGLGVRVASFEAVSEDADLDGVWANFSLLHARRADFPGHLRRLRAALVPGGCLSLGMKLGAGEGRDALGRLFTYYSEAGLRAHLDAAGFEVLGARTGHGHGIEGVPPTFVVLLARRPGVPGMQEGRVS